jgi:hypothetical protein
MNLPSSLDSLANGSRVTLSWGHFGVGDADEDSVATEIANTAQQACKDAEGVDDLDCTNSGYYVHTYALPRYREYLFHTIPAGATDFGFDATIGINDFEWVDPATLGQRREQHTDWSVAAHVAHYWPGTALTASASYQRAYEAADEERLCPPNPVDPATQCVTARGAAPARNEHFLLSVGARHRFTGVDGRLLPLAVAPQVTYDVIDDVFGVDVPIYLLAGPDGGLTGGVRLSYRSDRDDHFMVGLFFGAAFNVLQ